MKRAALLYCANIDVHRFKLLQRREHLPFSMPGGDDSEAPTWNDYTLDDAFRLRVLLEFMDAPKADELGLNPSQAVRIVDNSIHVRAREAADAAPPIWSGVVGFDTWNVDDEISSSRGHYCGPWDGMTAWMARQVEFFREAEPNHGPAHVFLVNISRSARFVLERARALGLPEADE